MAEDNKKEIKPGIYEHYKGNKYRFIGEAKQTESDEELVLYQSLEDKHFWARPKTNFLEEFEINGEIVTRFKYLGEEEVDDFEAKYLRALADYQNLLRQTAKDKDEFFQYALSSFLHDILPVYDNLKTSIASLSESESKSAWVEGIKYVIKQFKDVLNEKGVEEIKTLGEKFDIETMEAVGGEGEIVEKEIKAGYKLNGKVIVPAKVFLKS